MHARVYAFVDVDFDVYGYVCMYMYMYVRMYVQVYAPQNYISNYLGFYTGGRAMVKNSSSQDVTGGFVRSLLKD